MAGVESLESAGTWYTGLQRQVEPVRESQLVGGPRRNKSNEPLTLWYADHERVRLLTAAGALRVRAFSQRPPSFRDLHHQSIEMLTF